MVQSGVKHHNTTIVQLQHLDFWYAYLGSFIGY